MSDQGARERPRMTSVTGRTRDQIQQERAGLKQEAHHPGVRAAKAHLAQAEQRLEKAGPGGMVPLSVAQDLTRVAVEGAVQAVHGLYRVLLGEDTFARIHAAREGAREGDWSPQDEQLVLTGTQDGRSGYLNSSGRAEDSVQGAQEPLTADGALATGQCSGNVEVESQGNSNQPSGSQAGDGTPEGGQGKEGPPPQEEPDAEQQGDPPPPPPPGNPLACGHPGCDFVAGGERGLKAHKTAKKHG
jgi:hypothetical protein